MPQRGRPALDDLNEWTTETAFTALNETSPDDGTYVASPWAPAGEILRVKLTDLTDPLIGGGHTLRYRLKLGKAAAGITLLVRLVDDNQFKFAEWTHTTDLTTSWQTFAKTLTPEEANRIDDYAALYVEFVPTQDDATPPPSNDRGLQVSYVDLVTPDPPAGSSDRGLQVSYVDFTIADDLVGQGVHPRALITPDTLPGIRTKIVTYWATQFQTFVNAMDAAYVNVDGLTNNSTNAEYWRAMMSFAFCAQMDPADATWSGTITWGYTQAQYRDKAFSLWDAIIVGLAGTGFAPKDWTIPAMLAYDWLAPWMSDTVKNDWITVLYANTNKAPQVEDNPYDDQPAGRRAGYALSGMVTYGDCTASGLINQGNAAAQARYDWYDNVVQGSGTAHLDAADFMAGSQGGWSQGLEYADKPNFFSMYLTAEAFRTALGLDKDTYWLARTGLRYYSRWITQLVLPYESPSRLYMHRAWYGTFDIGFGGGASNHMIYAAASLYSESDPTAARLAQWLIDNGRAEPHNDQYYRGWFIVADLLGFGIPVTAVATPEDAGIGLSENFQPIGHVVARTRFGSSWFSSLDSHFSSWMANYSRQGTYWPPTQGEVTLERRGAAVIIHRGTSTHHNFNSGECSGNTMLFVPPVLTYTGTANGGTRKTAGKLKTYQSLVRGNELDVGGIRRYSKDGRILAFRGDLTRSYNSTSITDVGEQAGISRYNRSVVWCEPGVSGDPDVLVVCDRYRLENTTFEPRSLWQPSMAVDVTPTIGGSSSSYTRNGNSSGYLQYTGAGAQNVQWPLTNGGTAYLTHVHNDLGLARTVRVGGPNSDGVWNWPLANSQNFKIASITTDGSGTATCVTNLANNFVTGDEVTIGGTLNPFKALNVCAPVTVLTSTSFTFPCDASLNGSGSGTGDWIATKASHEFDRAFGASFVNDPSNNRYGTADVPRVGRYRVEFIPNNTGELSNTLINVIEAVDGSTAKSTTEAYTEGSTHVCVRVGSRLFAFAKIGSIGYTPQIGTSTTPGDENSVGSTVGIRINAVGTFTITICDLDPVTNYNVALNNGGTPSSSNEGADTGGVLTMTVTTTSNPTTVTLTRL